jgi:radical SAM superfamily enzyme YgiQ (UPF0313 family)
MAGIIERFLRRRPRRGDGPTVLLLTSPAPGKYAYGYYLGEKRFPLGIGYLISVLRQSGAEVDIYDLYARDHKIDFRPYDVIGIYADTVCFKGGTLPLISRIRESGFAGKIVVGGPHTSVLPGSIPEEVDFIVQGEGEEAIVDIVEGRVSQRLIKSPRIENLDALPVPAYDAFRLKCYSLRFEENSAARSVFTYSSSRGCPFDCRFCSSKSIYNRIWTSHSAPRVVDDMQYLKERFGADGIYFREDNFSVDMNRVRQICELLIERNVRLIWKCESRVGIGRQDLQLMYDAGLRIVYVGFESGSQRLLDIYNKKIDLEQSREFVRNCKEIGIIIYGSFVVDTPWETKEDARLTTEFVEELDLDRVCLNKYIAMPGSEMYEDIIADPELAGRASTTVVRM